MADPRRQMMAYHRWRLDKIATVALAGGDEICSRETGGSFGSLKGIVWHLAWAEEIWYHRCFQGASQLLKEGMTLDEMFIAWRKVSARWQDSISSFSENDWNKIVSYQNLQGQPFQNSMAEIFSHFTDHATYHTGQFMAQARAAGLEPAPCTMIIFFRETGNI